MSLLPLAIDSDTDT